MPYLSFIPDQHLMACVDTLYRTYYRCQQQMTLANFYSNKVDPIKFHFDMSFNGINPQSYLDLEIIRQNDKTISNAIGNFHQSLLGGLDGFYDLGVGNGCDLTNSTNTIFAEVKNKHNTMNSSSSEATFQKLASFADSYPNSTCYLLEIISKRSQDVLWEGSFNGHYYSHPRVRRISADRFYAMATGIPDAFYQLCSILPPVTHDYLRLNNIGINSQGNNNTLFGAINNRAYTNNRDILSQIMADNFDTYIGF